MAHTQKNIKITFLAVLLIKLFFCIGNKFSKKVDLNRGKNATYRFIEPILEEYDYCKKMIKKYLNKNLTMSTEEEKRFQLTNNCWICDKLLVDVEDDKVRDHCHIRGKHRGAAQWSCNINLELTKKIPIIFHNLRGYDSHLIIKEISKSKCNTTWVRKIYGFHN